MMDPAEMARIINDEFDDTAAEGDGMALFQFVALRWPDEPITTLERALEILDEIYDADNAFDEAHP